MTFLIAFPLIAGSLAALWLLGGRETRHPARNEEALIPAPIPGLLVPPGVYALQHRRENLPVARASRRCSEAARQQHLQSRKTESRLSFRTGGTPVPPASIATTHCVPISTPELQGSGQLCQCRRFARRLQ
jgi:hypothetical protein